MYFDFLLLFSISNDPTQLRIEKKLRLIALSYRKNRTLKVFSLDLTFRIWQMLTVTKIQRTMFFF